MRDQEKAEAKKLKNWMLWPVYFNGNPILENTGEALTYGTLVWPDNLQLNYLDTIHEQERNRFNNMMLKGPHMLARCSLIAPYIQFLSEALQACYRRDEDFSPGKEDKGL